MPQKTIFGSSKKLSEFLIESFLFIVLRTLVTLEHKTSLKSLGYICSNSQKYIVWVKIIDFFFYAKNH